MAKNQESQCYFVQLQIDSYLDGELSQGQRAELHSHLQHCVVCSREFQYAQQVYDAVTELPDLDCDDRVLEPIHRLGGTVSGSSGASGAGSNGQSAAGLGQWALSWLRSFPVVVRYAIPSLLLVALVLTVIVGMQGMQAPQPMVAAQPVDEPVLQYSAEDIQQALADLNLAIQYLNEVSQRTEVLIGERFLLTPLQDTLDASFERIRSRGGDALQNDPI